MHKSTIKTLYKSYTRPASGREGQRNCGGVWVHGTDGYEQTFPPAPEKAMMPGEMDMAHAPQGTGHQFTGGLLVGA